MRSKILWLAVEVVLPAVVLSSETGLAASVPEGTSASVAEAKGEGPTERDRARLLLSRATYGARPGDLEALVAQGTESWLDEQLQPGRIKDPVVDAKLARFENLELSTAELMKKYPRPTREERQAMQKTRERGTPMPGMRGRGPRTILRDLSHAKLVRAVHSERQLHEVMTDFWFNHFNVYARKNRNTLLALPSYERDAIRPHALGSFHDLLLATAEHPAMLFYLDNWINMKDGFNPREALRAQMGGRRRGRGRGRDQGDEGESRTFGINENYARELMELHTLGVDGGYDQRDVVEVARAMTGWSVVGPQAVNIRERIARRAGRNRVPAALRSMPDEGNFFFNQMAHDESPKTVLGTRIDEGGLDDGLQVIRLLSRHPSTARFISTKLAKHFVSDTPSDALVNEMSDTFLKTDGDISAVLRTMFLSPRFVEEGYAPDKVKVKVKTPLELVASALRVTGGDVDGPAPAHFVAELGMPLYLCQPPTGYDEDASAWLSAGSVLTRIRFAGALASGNIPGVRLPQPHEDPPELALLLASPDFQRQ